MGRVPYVKIGSGGSVYGRNGGLPDMSSLRRRSACLCRLRLATLAADAPSAQANRLRRSPNTRLRRVRFAAGTAAAPRRGRVAIERPPEPEHHQGCRRSMVTAGVRHSLQRAGNRWPHLALKSASHCSEHRKRTTAPLSTRSAPMYAVNRLVSYIWHVCMTLNHASAPLGAGLVSNCRFHIRAHASRFMIAAPLLFFQPSDS